MPVETRLSKEYLEPPVIHFLFVCGTMLLQRMYGFMLLNTLTTEHIPWPTDMCRSVSVVHVLNPEHRKMSNSDQMASTRFPLRHLTVEGNEYLFKDSNHNPCEWGVSNAPAEARLSAMEGLSLKYNRVLSHKQMSVWGLNRAFTLSPINPLIFMQALLHHIPAR